MADWESSGLEAMGASSYEQTMNTLQRLHAEQAQSPWIDFIDRELIDSGKLETLRGQGLRGLTSNPNDHRATNGICAVPSTAPLCAFTTSIASVSLPASRSSF